VIEKIKTSLDNCRYSPRTIACLFGGFTFLFRLPFVFRYDFFFGSDPGICYLMAYRILHGDRPFYFYSGDWQGAVESYITALLFKVFGPSIELSAAFSLLVWSIAVVLGVYLFIRATSKFHGIIAGTIAAIGVPYTLIYVTVPYVAYPASFLITMLVLLQAFFILEKGPSAWRVFWFGFVIGMGLYTCKQCIPGIAAALLALAVFKTSASSLRLLFRPIWAFLAVVGLLLGDSPEIYYKHLSVHPRVKDLSGLADPALLWINFKQVPKGLMAYFNAHPFSRIPTDVYFYHAIPFWGIKCANAFDVLFAAIGLAVLFFSLLTLKKALYEKNIGLFLLIALIFLNMTAVVLSNVSIGNIFNVRRYLHVSAITLSLLTGYFFTFYLLKVKNKILKWCLLFVIVLFPLRNAWDEYALLNRPDGLRELRWVIQDMKQQGLNRGISYYGPNYSINALSNEQIIIGGRDGDLIPEYSGLVSQADRIALIGYKGDPIEETVTFNGSTYKRAGDARLDELIQWTPYQKIQKAKDEKS